ncbi:SRPBCC family protein [Actinomadura decatromicini]|uniref:SRPBCC family protein n=1 Tax=Actinomadura decatromicini TaxID=2604572 RepID=UPI001FE5CB35|nr:SRPBCC family protein [Actinomadura decatromicini]
MELDHDFAVPVPVERAWSVLLDVERVATCMPGATLDSVEGEEYKGRMKVKVGAMTITYRGTARIVSADESARTVTLEASAKEARGSGTASATVQAKLHEEKDGTTRVTVHTKLNVTGRPAQFGRNILSEVGSKVIARFAKALAEELESPDKPEPEAKPKAETKKAEPKAETKKAEPKTETAPEAAAPPETPTPIEEAPAEKTPAEKTPAKKAEAEKAPADEAPAEEPPADKAKDDKAKGKAKAVDAEKPADKPGPATSETLAPVSDITPPERKAEPEPEPVERKRERPLRVARDDDAIDLLEVAGPSVAKRAVPAVGGVVAVLLAVRFLARRRRAGRRRWR